MFVYIYIIYMYIYICLCVYIVMNKTDRKTYFILTFHFRVNALRSMLVPLCLFIRHPLSPFQNSPYGHAE